MLREVDAHSFYLKGIYKARGSTVTRVPRLESGITLSWNARRPDLKIHNHTLMYTKGS